MFENLMRESLRSGVARMDEFEAAATWDQGGSDLLVVKFDSAKLSPEKLAHLDRFRTGNPPIMLQLAGGVRRKATIVGHGARDSTFYLTWL